MFDWKWWLVARVLAWGVIVGSLWGFGVGGTCYGLLSIDHTLQPNTYLDWDTESGGATDAFGMFALVASVVLVCWFAPRGFLVGALCGFYAPASRLNPLRSRFLWGVTRSTVQLEGAGFLVSAISAKLFAVMVDPFGGICVFLVLELIGFGLALWSALNRALRAEEAKVSGVVAVGFGRLGRGV